MTTADPPGSGAGAHAQAPAPRRWIIAVALAWAVVLAAGIGWAVARGEPTAREQTTVAEARPTVDRATAELAAAATADGLSVVAVSGFDRAQECSVTVVRGGARYERVLTALVAPGTEQALLQRVAARLPAGYGARVRTGAVPRLSADAGFFVGVSGAVIAPGQVRFVVDTGNCRPEGDLSTASQTTLGSAGPSSAQSQEQRASVTAVLTGLGIAAQRWTAASVPCPGGATLTTVEAIGAQGDLPDFAAQLAPAAPAVVVGTAELFAFHTPTSHVGVRVGGERAIISATSSCAG